MGNIHLTANYIVDWHNPFRIKR